jgi:anti-sigma regulatory factor (Ser/Thr protein kinase)
MRVEFVTNVVSYTSTVLRDRLCVVIVLSAHALRIKVTIRRAVSFISMTQEFR